MTSYVNYFLLFYENTLVSTTVAVPTTEYTEASYKIIKNMKFNINQNYMENFKHNKQVLKHSS